MENTVHIQGQLLESANRIVKSFFEWNGQSYFLSANENHTHFLHDGKKTLYQDTWDMNIRENVNEEKTAMDFQSPKILKQNIE